MKIATMTWFSNQNYGTLLQAYALQDYLKNTFGADAKLIKYRPDESKYLQSFGKKTEHLFYKLCEHAKKHFEPKKISLEDEITEKYPELKSERDKNFNSFLSKIDFFDGDIDTASDKFDIFICGSDQIWNPQIIDKNFYLDFVDGKKKISYAASMGINYIPDYAKKHLAGYLKDFDAISLRESDCRVELEKISGKKISVVCDPTFLLSDEEWRKIADKTRVPNGKYILSYFLGDGEENAFAYNAADKLNIKNFILPTTVRMFEKSDKENYTVPPADFLALEDNSEFIITDSFHAICFAIIFKKDFCVVRKHKKSNPFNQNSRILHLLSITGLSDRLADNESDIKKLFENHIDYDAVYEKLNPFIEQSKQFLKNQISE